ncbi:H(+)-transporting V1 sector ATPase subunit A [Linnemannia gamsii]|uniref:H(+)-transporting V1 sector ATPase subunit A n=1 Tax=Linnemannia gamsii TaxID=64522 RepID=A0ABQ7JL48_9FUNG|nr:H(+)-transporting V1 sector ATPase subunit A [Linnemannia gamsii]
MDNNLLTLFCLVDGEGTSNAFSVKIASTDTVDDLKEHIKTKKSPEFDDIAADKLTLWSVSILITRDYSEIPILFNNIAKEEKEKLHPADDLSDIFDEKPPKKPIHIFVQRPPQVHAPVPTRALTPLSDGSRPSTPLSGDLRADIKRITDKFFAAGSKHAFSTVSGCGKTRSVIELLCLQWGFYFNAAKKDLGSSDLSQLAEFLDAKTMEEQGRRQNTAFARNMTLVLFLSRILVLKYCLQIPNCRQTFSSASWTVLLVCPYMFQDVFSELFSILYNRLEGLTIFESALRPIVRDEFLSVQEILAAHAYPNFSSETRMRLVVDEAQILSDKGCELYQSSFLEADPRPMLSSMGLEVIVSGVTLDIKPTGVIASIGASAGLSPTIQVGEISQNVAHWPDDYLGLVTFTCTPKQTLRLATAQNQGAHVVHDEKWGLYKVVFRRLKCVQGALIVVGNSESFQDSLPNARRMADTFARNRSKDVIYWTLPKDRHDLVSAAVQLQTYHLTATLDFDMRRLRYHVLRSGFTDDFGMQEKLAYIWGTWIADGDSIQPKIAINRKDKEQIARIEHVCYDLGLTAWLYKHSEREQAQRNMGGRISIISRVHKHSNYFMTCLRRLGFGTPGSKYVPRWLRTESISVREHFLAGLIDADRCRVKQRHQFVSNNYGPTPHDRDKSSQRRAYKEVQIATIYPKIAEGVYILARSLGIPYQVNYTPATTYGHIKRQQVFRIGLLPCSALTNVLSLCAVDTKWQPAPVTFTRHHIEYRYESFSQDIIAAVHDIPDLPSELPQNPNNETRSLIHRRGQIQERLRVSSIAASAYFANKRNNEKLENFIKGQVFEKLPLEEIRRLVLLTRRRSRHHVVALTLDPATDGFFVLGNNAVVASRDQLSPVLNGFRGAGGAGDLTIIYCGTGLSIRTLHWALSSGEGVKEARSEIFPYFEVPGWTGRDSIQSYIERVMDHLPDKESKNMLGSLLPPEAIVMLHKRLTGRFRPVVTAIEGIILRGDSTQWEAEINDTEAMITSWKDRERRGNLCGEILRLENKIAQNSKLVEAAFGRIKIFGGTARTVLDEPFVLKATFNYFREKDPSLMSAAERAMLHSDNASVHGNMWEACMPPVFVETFKSRPLLSWPLLTKTSLPDQLVGDVTIVGYDEQQPKLVVSYRNLTTQQFMKAHVEHGSKQGDQDIPPFYFPDPQLKLRQVLVASDVEKALGTVSSRAIQEKMGKEQEKI